MLSFGENNYLFSTMALNLHGEKLTVAVSEVIKAIIFLFFQVQHGSLFVLFQNSPHVLKNFMNSTDFRKAGYESAKSH